MKINHLIKTSMVALFLVNSSLAGTEVENPTDPLRDLFTQARASAQEKVRTTEFCKNDPVLSSQEGQWIIKNQKDLEYDIQNSKHVWSKQPANTCVKTELKSLAPLKFSFPACKNSSKIDFLTAERMLIHESVHHFNIADEAFAERVANLVQKHARLGRVCAQIGFDPNKDPVRVIELGHNYRYLSGDRVLIYNKQGTLATLTEIFSGKKIKTFSINPDSPDLVVTPLKNGESFFGLFDGTKDFGDVTFYSELDGRRVKSFQYTPKNLKSFLRSSYVAPGSRPGAAEIDPSLEFSYRYRGFRKTPRSARSWYDEEGEFCFFDLTQNSEVCQMGPPLAYARDFVHAGEGIVFLFRNLDPNTHYSAGNRCSVYQKNLKTMKEVLIYRTPVDTYCDQISDSDGKITFTVKFRTRQEVKWSFYQIDPQSNEVSQYAQTVSYFGNWGTNEYRIGSRYFVYEPVPNAKEATLVDLLSNQTYSILMGFGRYRSLGNNNRYIYVDKRAQHLNGKNVYVFDVLQGVYVDRIDYALPRVRTPNNNGWYPTLSGQHFYTVEGSDQYNIPFKLFLYETGLK